MPIASVVQNSVQTAMVSHPKQGGLSRSSKSQVLVTFCLQRGPSRNWSGVFKVRKITLKICKGVSEAQSCVTFSDGIDGKKALLKITTSVLDLRTATELAVPVASFNLSKDKSQYRMECVPSVASSKELQVLKMKCNLGSGPGHTGC